MPHWSHWLDWFTPRRVRTALILLSSAAAALAILSYFVVFFPSGSYSPVATQGPNTTFSTVPTSTVSSSTFVIPTSTGQTATPQSTSSLSTDFTYPYPLTWDEGHEEFSITAVSLVKSTLTVTLAIQMGNSSECVPDNVRYVADEAGTLKAPDSPSGANFTFPDTQTCQGTPDSIYSQSLSFTVDPTVTPLTFTTGGASNQFFQVATGNDGQLDVTTPSTTD